MCPLVTDAVDTNLNDILDTVDLKADIDDNCYIDYSLVQPPFVIKDAIFVNGKGKWQWHKSPKHELEIWFYLEVTMKVIYGPASLYINLS